MANEKPDKLSEKLEKPIEKLEKPIEKPEKPLEKVDKSKEKLPTRNEKKEGKEKQSDNAVRKGKLDTEIQSKTHEEPIREKPFLETASAGKKKAGFAQIEDDGNNEKNMAVGKHDFYKTYLCV